MKLKPRCPWCFNTDGTYVYTKDAAAGIDRTAVLCRKCLVQGPAVESRELTAHAARKAAVDAWEAKKE